MSEQPVTVRAIERVEANFRPLLGLLVLFYLLLEGRYAWRLPLVADEFQGFYSVARLRGALPYVDFVPYKTVLGYYIQLPLTLFSDDPWLQLMSVKLGMVGLVGAAIFAGASRLARQFRPAAVLLATLVLVFMSTFLERSAVLRVDMLTGLAGLFALLFLLERKIVMAGLLTGLAFLVSQKGAYYGVAGGAALASHWAFTSRDRRSAVELIRYAAAAGFPIAIYFALWIGLSSYEAVFDQVVVKGTRIASASFYQIQHFWFQTFFRNPYFWALSLLALGQLYALRERSKQPHRDWMLLVFASTLFLLCLWHRQPWPYFFVLLIPTAWVLLVAFYDLELASDRGLTTAGLAALLVLGLGLPASRIPSVLERDNRFQRFNVSAANTILDEGDTYLAGLEMLSSHRQASRSLAWLDRVKLERLAGEDDVSGVIDELAEARLKLVIGNYRIPGLPEPVLHYLHGNYLPLFGNILIYAPEVAAGSNRVEIEFSGAYRFLGPPGSSLEIGGRGLAVGEIVELGEGTHTLQASREARLQLLPEGFAGGVDERFLASRALFEDSYTY